MKPRVFVGSSSETIPIAYAVQENLEKDFEVTVWTQDVFELSTYPIDALLDQLRRSDFGIFVLGGEDVLSIRGEKYSVTRDNVIYELGMFTGRLGRRSVFALVPRGTGDLHLPGDLAGLTYAEYEKERTDGNVAAAVGAACNKIRKAAKQTIALNLNELNGVERAGLFPDFNSLFEDLLRASTDVSVAFIHSRRWRENYDALLRDMLTKKESKLRVFLPDIGVAELVAAMKSRFDDGPHIPGFVADAYRYFSSLKVACCRFG